MTIRTGAALAVVLAAVGVPAAVAAPKAACQLLTDAPGDGTTFDAVPSRDAIDILSADVATGSRNLVGVLRLASLASDPTMVAGSTYRLSWTSGGRPQALSLMRYSDGTHAAAFDPNTTGSASGDEIDVSALVDTATSSIVWTVPRKANPVLSKKGAKFSGLAASAEAAYNLAAPNFTFSGSMGGGDTASSGKSYTDRAPSCVKGV